ncbi:CsbD family protein [Arcanobacterium hippocoleae]
MGFDETLKNKAEEFAGTAKEKFGEVTGDEHTAAEGRADKAEAQGKEFLNKAGEKLEEVKESLSDAGAKVAANVEAGVEKVKDIFGKKDGE